MQGRCAFSDEMDPGVTVSGIGLSRQHLYVGGTQGGMIINLNPGPRIVQVHEEAPVVGLRPVKRAGGCVLDMLPSRAWASRV